MEYLTVELQVLIPGTLVGILRPERGGLIDQFGTLLNLELLLACNSTVFLHGRMNLFYHFIGVKLLVCLDDLGLLGIFLGYINLGRHERTILCNDFLRLVFVAELKTFLV